MPWWLQTTTAPDQNSAVLQVFSTRQHAVVIAYGYPYVFSSENFLTHLAEVNDEPQTTEMLQSASTFCLTRAWADLDDYVQLVAASIIHDYVPLDPTERIAYMAKG